MSMCIYIPIMWVSGWLYIYVTVASATIHVAAVETTSRVAYRNHRKEMLQPQNVIFFVSYMRLASIRYSGC